MRLLRWSLFMILCSSAAATGQPLRFTETVIPTPGAVPSAIAVSNFQSRVDVLVTELEGNRIVTATPPLIEIPIPTPGSGPAGIAFTGAEYWFTESRANRIGRLRYQAPAFVPTFLPEIPIPTPESAPRGIAISRSGFPVWFTEFAGNKIASASIDVTTSLGTVTAEYPLPIPGSGPSGIFVDDSLKVWFTEFNANKIGRLDPTSGAIFEYQIPTADSGPLEIVRSGDSTWFTESRAGKIGRLLSNGTIVEYPLPDRGSAPSGITADASGGVWFAEQATGRVGRVTPGGAIREFPLPTPGSGPTAILAFTPSTVSPGISQTIEPPRLVVAEAAASRIAAAEADMLVTVGAGASGPWITEFEFSNPRDYPLSLLAPGLLCLTILHQATCADPIVVPRLGTVSFAVTSPALGFENTFLWFSTAFDLPTVRARVVRPDHPPQSVALPVVRLSTIESLAPSELSFPSAVKSSSGARSNLILWNDTNLPEVIRELTVEVFSSAGELLGSGPFRLSGRTLFIQDVVGQVGVASLDQGTIRVRITSGSGIVWGVLISARDDGSLISTVGTNP